MKINKLSKLSIEMFIRKPKSDSTLPVVIATKSLKFMHTFVHFVSIINNKICRIIALSYILASKYFTNDFSIENFSSIKNVHHQKKSYSSTNTNLLGLCSTYVSDVSM